MTKPMVYVAGPISSDPLRHTRDAMLLYSKFVRDDVVVPFSPHLSCFVELLVPLAYETWLTYDFAVIEHCQAVYRIPGVSPGADREVAFAESLHLPVFYELTTMYKWAADL